MARASHLSIVHSAAPNEPDDPIFEVIERHHRVAAIWGAAVHREFELEGKDDTLYAEAKRVTEEQATEKGNACVDLVTIYPTTIEGVIALLRYYGQSASLDCGTYWPDYLGDSAEEYGATIARHAAAALERITQLG
jgi:hypothetical protein